MVGPSDLTIALVITRQAPERFRIFLEFWSRYLGFTEHDNYTSVHKLYRAFEIYEFPSLSKGVMLEKNNASI